LYAKVIDTAGKVHFLSVSDMMNSVIGFADQREAAGSTMVEAQDHGEMKRVPKRSVQYWISDPTTLYTVTTNLVPFMNSNHPGRLTMAGKALPQSLSLVNREKPLVQTLGEDGKSMVETLGRITSTIAPVDGIVHKADSKEIVIKDAEGNTHKVKAVKNLPFNMKGFHDDETPLINVGDKVKKYQPLYDNNYTKDGVLSLGKNLTTAYLPYRGYNHEDGIVISRSAAESLSSHHAYKVDYDVVPSTVAKKALVKRYFPGKYTAEQLNKLDDNGYAKVGSIIEHGDPVYAVLEKREPSPEDRLLGRLHKSLVNPYRLVTEEWHHDEQGSVVDSHTDSKSVRILLRSIKPLEVGDKLTGLHGNKGIISLIQDDEHMPIIKATGKPVDLVLNPASVTSRINLGQIMETIAGKIAVKTGKPYLVKNFESGNNVTTLQAKLKEHGLSDTDELVDGQTGKSFGQVLTGPQYIVKLYKTSDQNKSARSVAGYDNNHQPTKGGEEGSKSVGWMEMLGLLGSDARKNLKEISTVKSEQNDEYWTKFIRGEALPKPKTTFATKKFLSYLTASGIHTNVQNGMIKATPLTDHQILAQSNGEIKEPLMLNSKNLEPEEGGLYDHVITGGMKGTRWSHYKLAEPIVNPAFENPVKSILGLSTTEFEHITSGKYGVKHLGEGTFELRDTTQDKAIRLVKV
jgi:DNA-directed RNA polymerase subunit beta